MVPPHNPKIEKGLVLLTEVGKSIRLNGLNKKLVLDVKKGSSNNSMFI